MVKEQKFEPAYAESLIKIARQDLKSAKILAREQDVRIENIFLLAQQGLEKGLKAVLCFNKEPVPFVHDIGILVTLVSKKKAPPFAYDLNSLTEYATIRRYLEGFESYDRTEINEILAKVEQAIEWCSEQVKIK